MNGVGEARLRDHHFTQEDEEALRRDGSTAGAMAQARNDAHVGGTAEEIRGDDKSWRAVKAEQMGLHPDAWTAGEFAHAGYEGLEIAGLGLEGHVGMGLAIAGPIGGFILGAHQLYEAHKKGEEQSAAIAKDQVHVALIGTLDLPEVYKAHRYAAYPDVGRENRDTAKKIADNVDPKTKQLLQLHADRGMHAGLDLVASGKSKEDFLKSNDVVAKAYAEDAAFHEGFDAVDWASRTTAAETKGLSPKDVATVQAAKQMTLEQIKNGLQARDGWYAQAHVSIRV